MSPRIPWLLFYVFSNMIAGYLMLDSGILVGDVAGISLYSTSALIVALVLVISSYILILGPLFNFTAKIKIPKIHFLNEDVLTADKIGKLLLILQIIYFVFNFMYGVNIAGAEKSEDNIPFSLIWVFIPIDMLVVIYYGFYRDSKYFYPNLFIWLISNFIRGWSGVFLFVIFFEFCRNYRNGTITFKKIAIWSFAIVTIYPIIVNLKWLFRATANSTIPIWELLDGLLSTVSSENYFSLILDSLTQIITRFQTTSNVVEVIRMRDLLQDEFSKGNFTPFWSEGIHGIIYEKLIYGVRSIPIGTAFTSYENFDWDFTVGAWNTNIGYVGWFFIAPYLSLVYIFYTVLLGYLSFLLVKKIGSTDLSIDMIWLCWLVYLLPPWHAAFINFIYSLLVFLTIKLVFAGNFKFRRFFPINYKREIKLP
jgi:hypothetical protein